MDSPEGRIPSGAFTAAGSMHNGLATLGWVKVNGILANGHYEAPAQPSVANPLCIDPAAVKKSRTASAQSSRLSEAH